MKKPNALTVGVFLLALGLGLCWWAHFAQSVNPKRTEPVSMDIPIPGFYGIPIDSRSVTFWGVCSIVCGVTVAFGQWANARTKTGG